MLKELLSEKELMDIELMDGSIGMYAIKDTSSSKIPPETMLSCYKYLGNITTIYLLSRIFEDLLTKDSIIYSGILYSGSHCCDVIEYCSVPQLEKEIKHIGNKRTFWRLYPNPNSPKRKGEYIIASKFIQDIQDLVDAAYQERNPICF
jgi:hypothetical protein